MKPYRNKKYLKYVSSLDCCMCGAPADEAHHIIGLGSFGGMGTKASDILTMPVCRGCHTKIHQNPEYWQEQPMWILKTIDRAAREGEL